VLYPGSRSRAPAEGVIKRAVGLTYAAAICSSNNNGIASQHTSKGRGARPNFKLGAGQQPTMRQFFHARPKEGGG
jgi:hypothetical protein